MRQEPPSRWYAVAFLALLLGAALWLSACASPCPGGTWVAVSPSPDVIIDTAKQVALDGLAANAACKGPMPDRSACTTAILKTAFDAAAAHPTFMCRPAPVAAPACPVCAVCAKP